MGGGHLKAGVECIEVVRQAVCSSDGSGAVSVVRNTEMNGVSSFIAMVTFQKTTSVS